MLKGQELLAKIQEMGAVSRTDVARACGYVSTKKDGSERINFTAFYEAITEAKGVTLAPPASKTTAKRGKAPSYKSKIAKTGTCPVGGAYTSQAGWGPGDEIGITVTGDTITLTRTAAPVVVTPSAEPAVITYESKPAPVAAEREPAPF